MTSSLVGSEMCIRDRCWPRVWTTSMAWSDRPVHLTEAIADAAAAWGTACLLYTSDAADDM
eukprot:11496579-Prorocentrum_lima.AAC.1